jgi:outer membrane protein OmpA-like peptidoglycan-associated protein
VQTFDLSTETLFRFARASVTDIKPDGLKELDEVASKLKEHLAGIRSIEIIGYTDRLGTESYNKTLSERRAYAVFSYLIGQGIPSDKVVVEGYGELDPVRSCPDTRGHAELIACLAPNRRVVVRAID